MLHTSASAAGWIDRSIEALPPRLGHLDVGWQEVLMSLAPVAAKPSGRGCQRCALQLRSSRNTWHKWCNCLRTGGLL